MAGLPKSGRWLLFAAFLVLCFSAAAAAQSIDPPIVDVQTPPEALQPLVDAIALNVTATDIQKDELVSAFTTAVAGAQLTLDQALAMLALVSWETLADEDAITQAADAIGTVLARLADGTLTGDPVAELADALAAILTPAGVTNAIARAGGSEELLAQVDTLVAAGVPPGILVRLAKQSLREGLTGEDITALLTEFASSMDGDSWGRVANDVAADSSAMHTDQERNMNSNRGTQGAAEEEQEENQHGNGNNGKKG